MNIQEQRQKEAGDSWINGKRNSILYLSPRTGKTRIGLNIINQLKFPKVLVTYPNTVIKKSWEAEIEKIGLDKKVQIDFKGILSLKNAIPGQYSLLVLDEIHALSEAQIESIKYFKSQNPSIRILGLTGSLSVDTESILKQELGMDICYRYSLDQAIKEGVVADYQIKIIEVPLDSTVKKSYGVKKPTLRTEKEQFDHLGSAINWMEMTNKPTFFKRLERMRLIQNSLSKLNKTKQLLDDQRSLVFCGVTVIADKIGCDVYHAKSNEKSVLEDFCNSKITNLAVCKMLGMGVTIQNLDRVILNYFSSNEEQLVQQINRAMNYEYKGKIAQIVIICSDEDVELKWLKRALKPLDASKISYG